MAKREIKSTSKPNAPEVGRLGVDLAMQELTRRGVAVRRATSGRSRNTLRARLPRGNTVEIYVKTRRTGTWQTDIRRGSPKPDSPDDDRFWIFVDLQAEPTTFYVAPAWWIENDIYETHQAYLARHGGRRARTPASNHHAISEDRIHEWREQWGVLGL